MSSIILLSPPLYKACEPPASLAFLGGSLPKESYRLYDINLLGQLWLLRKTIQEEPASDTWSRRAIKNGEKTLLQLKNISLYSNHDRYKRAVMDLNKLLVLAGKKHKIQLSLSDYQDNTLSPLSTQDLLQAAERYEENIFYPFFAKECSTIISEEKPQWIGISLNFLSQTLTTFALLGWLRKEYPELKIIVGGGLVTTWLNNPDWKRKDNELKKLAFFIKGEGEKILQKLLELPDAGSSLPDYTDIDNNYLAPGFILPYTTSRGCFWRQCSFCPETAEQNPFHHTAPSTTLQHLETLCERYQPQLIHFLDNSLSTSTLTAIVNTPLPAPWYGFTRFNHQLTNLKFCEKLRRSGCIMLKLGLESGDQNLLNEMKKGIHLRQVDVILANLKEVGIATYIYLLFGTPAEDRNAAERTLDYVAAHEEEIGFLNLAIFNMPRLAPEHKAYCIEKSNSKEELSIYTQFRHPKGWNKREIRRFLSQQFRKHSAIAPILQRDPPFFTSNHAPFFIKEFSSQLISNMNDTPNI